MRNALPGWQSVEIIQNGSNSVKLNSKMEFLDGKIRRKSFKLCPLKNNQAAALPWSTYNNLECDEDFKTQNAT